MDIKEAVGTAKSYVVDLFSDEEITDVGLEEVVFDEPAGDWRVTIGFSRRWNRPNAADIPVLIRRHNRLDRSYKMVRIKASDGRVVSLTDRLLAERTD